MQHQVGWRDGPIVYSWVDLSVHYFHFDHLTITNNAGKPSLEFFKVLNTNINYLSHFEILW